MERKDLKRALVVEQDRLWGRKSLETPTNKSAATYVAARELGEDFVLLEAARRTAEEGKLDPEIQKVAKGLVDQVVELTSEIDYLEYVLNSGIPRAEIEAGIIKEVRDFRLEEIDERRKARFGQ